MSLLSGRLSLPSERLRAGVLDGETTTAQRAEHRGRRKSPQ